MKHQTNCELYRTLKYNMFPRPFKPDLEKEILHSVEYIRYCKDEAKRDRKRYRDAVAFWSQPIEKILEDV